MCRSGDDGASYICASDVVVTRVAVVAVVANGSYRELLITDFGTRCRSRSRPPLIRGSCTSVVKVYRWDVFLIHVSYKRERVYKLVCELTELTEHLTGYTRFYCPQFCTESKVLKRCTWSESSVNLAVCVVDVSRNVPLLQKFLTFL